MVSEELKQIFANMSRRQIVEVKTYLHQLYKTASAENIDMYRRYVSMVETVWGRNIEKTRHAENVWMRCMVADLMRRSGVSIFQIAKCMGMNHSSVTHCLEKIKSMQEYPRMYPNEWELYNELIEKYETDRRTI